MPYATTKDNVKLYYEEAGTGSPILFCHEFAGDYRNWEPQMRFLSRRHARSTSDVAEVEEAPPVGFLLQHLVLDHHLGESLEAGHERRA